jgi:hypothetical protein
MRSCLPPLVALAAALAVAGCGDGWKDKVDVDQIRSVVTDFAQADDASACKLLSEKAIVDVYGGFKKSPRKSRTVCERRAKGFKGEPVEITNVNLIDPKKARVSALNPDETVAYGVNLSLYGKRWLIDSISQAKPE